jgi:hypothetical protein
MSTLPFQSSKLAPEQWIRLGRLIRAYRREHDSMTQDDFAERLTRAVQAAAADAAVRTGPLERYDKSDVSRIEAWARPRGKRPRRLPQIAKTYQLEGLAAVLGMRAEDMLGTMGEMSSFNLDAPTAQVTVLADTLQRHQKHADAAIVWSKHLISMFFPSPALYEYYRKNYVDGVAAEKWVSATEERREAVLGRAASRNWHFTNVIFASDLNAVVTGKDRFAGIDPNLRAECLEGLLRVVVDTPNCEIVVVDDTEARHVVSLQALKRDVGAFTHVSNMGDGCVILHDLLGVWHVGEKRRDVRAFRGLLADLVDAGTYRTRSDLEPYLLSLIQRTLLAYG